MTNHTIIHNGFMFLYKLYRQQRPDLVHLVTIKPNIYGSLAAMVFNKISVINAISGMGYNFSEKRRGPLQRIIVFLMKVAYTRKQVNFIFQNATDREEYSRMGLTDDTRSILIKGSGVDLDEFKFVPARTDTNGLVTFILPARMLYDKGITILVDAAKLIEDKLKGKATVLLVGPIDTHNKTGISQQELEAMQVPGYIKWIGFQKDMLSVIENCQVVVLPSFYREGVPKALIEACAIGRPIITTNMPGCNDCVKDGFNGYLLTPKSVEDLAQKMLLLFNDAELRCKMGANSRTIAEESFSIKHVIESTLALYDKVLSKNLNGK